jgi:hypothetical protein
MRVASVAAVWAFATALLFWGRLPGRWRRTLAVLTNAAGLLFLILAVTSEGLRESPTVTAFLLGTPYVTQSSAASASLPYYALTGVCLLLGTLGLAVRDDVAARLARHWMTTAITLSLAVTVLRFVLEKVAAPTSWTYPVGIVWLGPFVGAYFALNVRAEGKSFGTLLRALAVYALAVRGFVAGLVAVASTLQLGTHYDVTRLTRVRFPFSETVHEFAAGSFDQVLYVGVLPQLLFWPVFTLVTGLLGAVIVLLVTGSQRGAQPAMGVVAEGPRA